MRTILLEALLFLFFSVCALVSVAQNKSGMQLPIKRATAPIVLDGKLDEEDWKNAFVATDFYLNYPIDTALAPYQSEARLTFDDHNLYVAFVCYDDTSPRLNAILTQGF